MATAQELPIDTTATAEDMADAIFGEDIQVVSASFSGASSASGLFSDGETVAPHVTPSDFGVILSTGKATDITNSSGDANVSSGTSTNHGLAGDSDLDGIAGSQTYDAAVLEASFIPQGEFLTMQLTFSSEEYLEYVNEGFNDAVGIFVNGEQATLTVGDGDLSVNNINNTTNQNLYIDNPASADNYNTEMDGMTTTLTLKAPVVPGQVNVIKIAIADGGDGAYDSNLLIAGNSVQSGLVAHTDSIVIDGTMPENFDVLANDTSSSGSKLTITHINGQEVFAGDTITLPSGEDVTLNGDGTLTFVGDGDAGNETLSYTIADTAGNTDVGYIELTTTPCFVAGTPIDTPEGPVAVEFLRPGQMILTRDDGPQPLRWLGITRMQSIGRFAPVVLEHGALGNHRHMAVSPQHRILLSCSTADMLFGAPEILVKARDLINGGTIHARSQNRVVTYVHMLFDRHQIVRSCGLWSESYHPGAETLEAFDADTRDEVLALLPSTDATAGYGYGPTARLALKSFEARMIGSQAERISLSTSR